MKRTLFIFSFLLLLCFVFLFQGKRGIFESTEGRYANVAYVMLKTNDWVHPKLNLEQPLWTKPPMYYWTIALSMKTFGQNTFAIRFPGALSFLLTLILVFQLGKVFFPLRPWLPSFIYATSFMPFAASNAISTDGLLCLFETAGMTCFAFIFFTPLSRKKGVFISLAGSVCWGLAFLTKGPPALLPIFGLMLFLVLDQQSRKSIKIINLFVGIVVFILLASSWFIFVIKENHSLIKYFLNEEVVNRVASNKFNRNSGFWGGFITYIPTLLIGSLPWIFYPLRGLYSSVKKMPYNLKGINASQNRENLFFLSWLFIPLIIFFIAESRLPLYILPLFIPLALIAAKEIPLNLFERKPIKFLLATWVILLISFRGISGSFDFPQDSRLLAEKLKNLCPPNCSEIVFVDTKPQYGLSIYLDIPIEKVIFLEKDDSYFSNETITEELLFNEPDRVWMVPQEIAKEFTEFIHNKNCKASFLQWVKGKKTYGVYTISN